MNKHNFGTELIRIRKIRGLTQADIAEKCNVTTRTIQRIESGVVKPRSSTIKIICKTLGIDFFEISNQNLKLKNHKLIWLYQDLFNFKTNSMKKISILTTAVTIIVFVCITAFDILIKPNSHIDIQKIELKTIDKQELLPVEYDFIGEFGEIKKDWAIVMKGDKYGLIGTNGKIVVPVEYDFFGKFGEIKKGWTIVMKGNKYGLLNLEGKEIIPCEYEKSELKKQMQLSQKTKKK
jgi:transcriptional regulator with XRE-family HTH domain